MEGCLGEAIAGRGVGRISDYRELGVPRAIPGDEAVFAVLDRLLAAYGELLVLYGGIAATERVYGLKRIRDISTDLDFALEREGLEALLGGGGPLHRGPSRLGAGLDEGRLLYHADYDILFALLGGVPLSFAYGHIHDWPLDPGFFAEAEILRPAGRALRCASRRHAVMLKFRRSATRLREGLEPFGKDCLDILNILAGSACGSRRAALDPAPSRR